jgi:hypothetical protein
MTKIPIFIKIGIIAKTRDFTIEFCNLKQQNFYNIKADIVSVIVTKTVRYQNMFKPIFDLFSHKINLINMLI